MPETRSLRATVQSSSRSAYLFLGYAMFAWGVNVSIVKVLSSHLEALPLSAVRMLLALVFRLGNSLA
jgi:uncharacterized membrane protein YadS